jgi:serine/threonine protein phosphatase PrpC
MSGDVVCPGCGANTVAGDLYCEACGADLQVSAAPRQPQPRDHQELDRGWAAGVCDRGLHHERNEDALFLAATAPGRLAVAVCDGVSSSLKADIASQTAVNVIGRFLAELLTNGDDPTPALTKAVAAAQEAVVAIPWVETAQMSAPSCTLVAAAVIGDVVSLCSIGDSRAYWLGSDGARQLTTDDSWAGEQVAAGVMTESEALADPRAHAITRWLGTDAPTDGPHLCTFNPTAPGRLLICTDGLWNYAPTPAELVGLIAGQPADATPLALSQALIEFALSAGGHDNITVVIADLAPADPKGSS